MAAPGQKIHQPLEERLHMAPCIYLYFFKGGNGKEYPRDPFLEVINRPLKLLHPGEIINLVDDDTEESKTVAGSSHQVPGGVNIDQAIIKVS